MARYLSLIKFTDRGVAEIRQSPERAERFRAAVEAAGGAVQNQYWAMGEYDGCVVFDVPDDDTATALLLRLAQEGFVRTSTLKLYDEEGFQQVLGKL